MIPSRTENPNGLHQKYRVTKADGSPCDPRAVYFVLRIDPWGDNDDGHTSACRKAALAYCDNAPWHMRLVANELRRLIESIDQKCSG